MRLSFVEKLISVFLVQLCVTHTFLSCSYWGLLSSFLSLLQTGWVKKHSELEYAKQGPSDTSAPVATPRRPFLARIFGRRKDDDVDNESVEDEEEPVAVDPDKPSPATLTRYVLASTAVALVGCNIYLFVSQ